MDGESGNEVKNDTERVILAHVSNEEDMSAVTVNGNEKEGVPAEVVASDHDEEHSESVNATEEAPVEEAATSEPEENGGDEVPAVSSVITSEDLAVKMSEEPTSHEGSVVFEMNGNNDDGPPRLLLESPDRENISPTQVEEGEAEEEEPTAAPADKEEVNSEALVQLLQDLCEGRDKASQHSSRLQMKLAEYFRKKAGDDGQLERELPVSEQLQEYEKHVNILTDLKQQLIADSETAEQQAEELSFQSQEKLEKVGLTGGACAGFPRIWSFSV